MSSGIILQRNAASEEKLRCFTFVKRYKFIFYFEGNLFTQHLILIRRIMDDMIYISFNMFWKIYENLTPLLY